MAAREHKWVKLGEGDTVVLSSSLIPGNEPAIHRVVDGLYRTGADVFHVPADPVHASGHARAGGAPADALAGPAALVHPVHGERRHLSASRPPRARGRHRRPTTSRSARTATSSRSGERVAVIGERVQAGMTFVDGLGIGDVGRRGAARPAQAVGGRRGRGGRHVDAHNGELVARPRPREPGVRLRRDLGRHP